MLKNKFLFGIGVGITLSYLYSKYYRRDIKTIIYPNLSEREVMSYTIGKKLCKFSIDLDVNTPGKYTLYIYE